jgi:hypothetical protein
MKKQLRNLLLFVFPFAMMVLVNHFIKSSVDPILNDGKWNSTLPIAERCTWACHDSTNYCIEHHVKINKLLLLISQPFYFGEITLLKMAGSYSLVNILILVTLVPLYLWYFLVRIIDTLQEIKEAKNDI